VIERAPIHVAGPPGAGKTTFIEAMLGASGRPILAARCVRDDALRHSRETAAKSHPELRRYREASASSRTSRGFARTRPCSTTFSTSEAARPR